ncbi:MAG: ABC transporter permease [Deltaproteobacteria bacterium]|nr:ABC transporter permease [Deltaproteobacteria bacterium]
MNDVALRSGLISDFFGELYNYREYLLQSVMRDLRNKYKRSILGYLWTMFHPLAMMGVLSIVFSHMMRVPIHDYAIFLFAGLLPWNFFNSTALMSLHSIRSNARLFGQIPVPKYIFVLSITFSNWANYVFALVPLLVLCLLFGRSIPLTVLAYPIVVLPLIFVTLGVSFVLAACNVFFDDTLHLSEVGLSMLYFLTPVLYARDMLPPNLVHFLVLNPLFNQIEFLRNIFYDGVLPNPETFAINFVLSFMIFAAGLAFFRRFEDRFLYFI